MLRWIPVIVSLFMGTIVLGQTRFMAYSVSGSVTYTDNKKQQPLKVGRILDQTKSVRIGKGASLTLICESTSTAVTLAEGEHSLAKLTGVCATQNASMSEKYLKYVWWQMTHPGDSKNAYSDQGAVSRGCVTMDQLSPDTINIFQEPVMLRWKTSATEKIFVLYMHETGTIPYAEIPVKKNYLLLDTANGKLERSTSFVWTIRLDGKEECPKQLIQVWSAEDFAELENELLAQIIPGISNAEQDYMMGFLLEANKFYGEAYKYFKSAAKIDPGNKRYKSTLQHYNKLFSRN